MGAYLRGRWYWYRRTIEGVLYRRPLDIKKGQESMLSARMAQVDEIIAAEHFGLPSPAHARAVLFSEYAQRYLQRKERNATIDRNRQRIDTILELWPDLKLNEYTRDHIEELERKLFAFKAKRASGLKPATVNRYMELLRNLFNEAIEDKVLDDNPLRTFTPFAEEGTRRALTADEIKGVAAAAGKMKAEKSFGPIKAVFEDLVLFALATGLRLSSILNLKKAHIIDDVLAIPITATKSKRRGRIKQQFHIIPLSPLAQDIIRRQPDAGDFVFPIHRRHPDAIGYAVKYIRDETGIKDFTFHHLRHTVSSIVSRGAGLHSAMSILGHEDIRTTLRYTHKGLEEQRAAVTNLGTFITQAICKK